jgi:hypothetical protein
MRRGGFCCFVWKREFGRPMRFYPGSAQIVQIWQAVPPTQQSARFSPAGDTD